MQTFSVFLVSLLQTPIWGQPCVPDWICTEWTPCDNGMMYRTCKDTNGCGTTAGMPRIQRSCPIGVPPSQAFRRGDADADRRVNLTDAVFTLNFLFRGGAQPDCQDALDANDDGLINLTDPIVILNHLFLGGLPLASPFSAVGSDPTPDNLGCEDYPYCSEPSGPFPLAPSYCVAFAASTPQPRPIARGEKNVVFLKVKVTAAEREVTPMNGIQLGTRIADVNAKLTNVRAEMNGVILGTIGVSMPFNGDYFYHWVMLEPTLVIPALESVLIDIVGDVREDATGGTVNLGIFSFNFQQPGAYNQEYRTYEGNLMTIAE